MHDFKFRETVIMRIIPGRGSSFIKLFFYTVCEWIQ